MTNSDNGSALAYEIIQSIAAAYGWRGMSPREREAVSLAPATLQTFAGKYQSPQLGIAHMRVEDDHLVISSAVFSDLEFYPASATRFFPLTGNFPEITFVRNEKGDVVGAEAGEIKAAKLRDSQ
jgi:hypothetical protein